MVGDFSAAVSAAWLTAPHNRRGIRRYFMDEKAIKRGPPNLSFSAPGLLQEAIV